ncbi:DUF2207 domain-containing protein [Chryseobacterium sp. TY4]
MKHLFLIFLLALNSVVFSQERTTIISLEDIDSEDYQDSLQNSNVQKERIIDFHSDIVISKKSVVRVTETIKVYADGYEIKRGLFRALPMIRNINGNREDVDYNIISIKKDGSKEPYHIERLNDVFNIYIGSKDYLLSSGNYTYEITYETTDQIGSFKTYDEFYWNVNGTDWSFPIEHISAKVTLPAGADIIQNSCYTGLHGSQQKNCTSKRLDLNEVFFEASNLKPKENLTVAVGFKPNILEAPSAFSKLFTKNKDRIPLILVACFLVFYFVKTWFRHGRVTNKPIVIPQFDAPYNMSPAAIGYIEKGEYEASHLAANLVDMAVKKVISLQEDTAHQQTFNTFRVYDIKKLTDNTEALLDDEKLIFKDIFGEKTSKLKIDGTYDTRLKNASANLHKLLRKNLEKFTVDITNLRFVYNALMMIVGTFLLGLLYASLADNNNFEMFGIGAMFVFFDGLIILLVLSLWKEFYKTLIVFVLLVFLILFCAPLFLFAFRGSEDMTRLGSDCFKFLIFGGISLLIFKYFIKRPSDEKVQMKSQIEGFKMYLGTAEEAQLKFHNPPEMTTDVYEKFLPYAIVLNVQDIWGQRFRKSLKSSLVNTTEFSEFAFDSTFASAFSMSVLESSNPPAPASFTSSSSDSSSYSSSSSRSSSSSSYSGGSSSSGSSGGGSSGGGGGGGGGGGW